MMKAATGSTQRERGRMYGNLVLAAGVLLGLTTVSATAQTLPAPGQRLCTVGYNNQFGWFENADGYLGTRQVSGMSQTLCTTATSAGLKVQLGTDLYPLADQVDYNLVTSPATATLQLLEPALCESYFSKSQPARLSGEAQWNLVLHDANGLVATANAMIPWVRGVASLNYAPSTGNLVPSMIASYGTTVPWLRCHSGLVANATLPQEGGGGNGDDDELFADGFEAVTTPPAGTDLQVAFFDMQDNPLSDVVLQPSGAAGNIQFKVRVKNNGQRMATDVRLREFVPTSTALLTPTVQRVACLNAATNTSCSNGTGASRFSQDLGNLAYGDSRTFILTRKSSNASDVSDTQPMPLIQVAAFADPNLSGVDANYADNSRSLRIKTAAQVTYSRIVATNGTNGNSAGGSIVRISAPATCSTESGAATTCPPGVTGVVYSATANNNYTFTGFTGCAGTNGAGNNETGGTRTVTATNSCNVIANFRSKPTVTATAGANGSITPATQSIHYGTRAQFTVTPATGYQVASITGCGGVSNVSGTTWQTTNTVTANCSVNATFEPAVYTVTATVNGNGTVTPGQVSVQHGQPAQFTVTTSGPEYQVVGITGTCSSLPGGWFGSSYMVPNITENCSVEFEVGLVTHPVTVFPEMIGGSIVLTDAENGVPHGQNVAFTVTPMEGYHYVQGSITGTAACGTLAGDAVDATVPVDASTNVTGTAGPITSAGCELSATFAKNKYTVTISLAAGHEANGGIGGVSANTGGSAPVVITDVEHGTEAGFAVFPNTGFQPTINHVDLNACNFTFRLNDSSLPDKMVYKASSVTANCTATVTLTQ